MRKRIDGAKSAQSARKNLTQIRNHKQKNCEWMFLADYADYANQESLTDSTEAQIPF